MYQPAADAVEAAKRALFLRTTTQIDELMKHSCSAIQQRWDFLGPTSAATTVVDRSFFAQIDQTLQWGNGNDDRAAVIGEYIRDAHFALELTEDQAEVLSPNNVRFALVDSETMHAYVPFAYVGDGASTFVVDLLQESGKWLYFGTLALDGRFPETADQLKNAAATLDDAKAAYAATADANDNNNLDSDGDDYWDQFLDLDAPEPPPPTKQPAPALPQHQKGDGAASALPYLLASSAQCAKDAGLSEQAFLVLAQTIFNQ
ncbi:hypothetical protein LPJ59_000138 [Coemansia sp. RSA 2399]|nr:hypothetical protein LPJ59_000138 [Coemansia sp. RSA 2399]KAJ1908420.1 hypothetical protein LPJ81_000129 [Coemansia sp. IMI 209127]